MEHSDAGTGEVLVRERTPGGEVSAERPARVRIQNWNVKSAERLEYWNELTDSTRYGKSGMPQVLAEPTFRADYSGHWVGDAGVVAGRMDAGSFLIDRQRADGIDSSRVQLILSGCNPAQIDARGWTHDIDSGSLYLQFHDEPRRVVWRKPDRQLIVDIDSTRLTLDRALLRRAMFAPLLVDREMVDLFVRSATRILHLPRPAIAAAGSFLVSLVELLVRTGLDDDVMLAETGPARREQALAVMRENLSRPDLSAEDVAAALNISRRSLFQLFDATPPMTVLRQMRIARAREVLSDDSRDDLTIEQVSRMCGFGTARGFNNAFLRESGQRPTDFRRNRGGPPAMELRLP
ncbi:MAG TPA: helix-turn-helix domain-containing protein [Actinophytocola sp.]|uniref:helix-turn-helix domain-containing protein n=1 Tax=Actinophytocola sp. TaxID=1872138 RepID=UPI002DBDEF13|nr:helix-turn-helix domain-containing protein [Actinophytocola sp.]HEU5473637.1 helix-turn-helix domain-containing protein [Actinophytocola sp.]